MPADYGRIHRLLRILTLIQSRPGWSARALARECGATERSIYRDLHVLQGAGVPYVYDAATRGYVITGGFFMPSVSLKFEESLALLALAQHIGGKEQIPFTRAAGAAVEKIRCSLPAPVRKEIDQIDGHVEIKLAAAHPPEAARDVFERIQSALSRRRMLRCDYDSASNPSPLDQDFLFSPYTLLFNQRAWYALGHHEKRKELRFLKLNRLTGCELTSASYVIPRQFSLTKHLGCAWRMIRGQTRFNVHLQFDQQFAETIADTQWHATQDIRWNDDKTIDFHCQVDGLDEIVWWIMSMGPHCRVIGPAELAAKVRGLALDTARLYEDPRSARRSRRARGGNPPGGAA